MGRLEEPATELVRRDANFKALELSDDDVATADQVASVLAENPKMMQRPVIDDGTTAFIGRPPAKLTDWLAAR